MQYVECHLNVDGIAIESPFDCLKTLPVDLLARDSCREAIESQGACRGRAWRVISDGNPNSIKGEEIEVKGRSISPCC